MAASASGLEMVFSVGAGPGGASVGLAGAEVGAGVSCFDTAGGELTAGFTAGLAAMVASARFATSVATAVSLTGDGWLHARAVMVMHKPKGPSRLRTRETT